jgi:rubrerythrin
VKDKMQENTLKFAIHNEVKAHQFYKEVAQKVKDVSLRELFRDLAEEENRHKAILESFHGPDPSIKEFPELPDYHVAETMEDPELSTDMKPADAFALAMKKEQHAMELYNWMANASADSRQKELLLELAAMERNHKSRMEQAFVDVGYPEVW